MVEAVPCFICIDNDGCFYGVNYCGGVNRFSDDFFEVIDVFINDKKWPEWNYFPAYE